MAMTIKSSDGTGATLMRNIQLIEVCDDVIVASKAWCLVWAATATASSAFFLEVLTSELPLTATRLLDWIFLSTHPVQGGYGQPYRLITVFPTIFLLLSLEEQQ
jgi:hypothetical protein